MKIQLIQIEKLKSNTGQIPGVLQDEIVEKSIAMSDEGSIKENIKYIVECEGIEGFTQKVWIYDEAFDIIWDHIRDTVSFSDEDEDQIIAIITPYAKKMQKVYIAKQKVARKMLRAIKKELYG